jgi:uncharacterized protein (TIGR00159 family)
MDFLRFGVSVFEILIIATMIYYFLAFFWNTRAMDLVFGLGAFVALYTASIWFNFPVIERLMLYFTNVAVIALLIIFQPELRIALSKLSVKGKKYREITEFDQFLDGMGHAIYRLSEKRIGGLVVIENQDNLDEFANKSVLLNAQFTPELLESIFSTTTPLHDGAVLIRGTTIISAATILPLADDITQLSKSMGTRHRAGLGISQITDAISIVISEESGKVSIARDGIMTRGVKIDRFKGILRSVFTLPKSKIQSGFEALEFLSPWKQ